MGSSVAALARASLQPAPVRRRLCRIEVLPASERLDDLARIWQSLRDGRAITVTDPDSEGEPRFVTLGMDALGRILVVVHTPRGDRVRIISARKASPGEAEHYYA